MSAIPVTSSSSTTLSGAGAPIAPGSMSGPGVGSSGAGPGSSGPSSSAPVLWEWEDSPSLHAWMQRALKAAVVAATQANSSKAASSSPPPMSDMVAALWKNMSTAALSIQLVEKKEENENEEDDNNNDSLDHDEEPRKKKLKKTPMLLQDPYYIWIIHQSLDEDEEETNEVGAQTEAEKHKTVIDWTDDLDDVPSPLGGRIAQLSVGGLMNAMAGVVGGVIHQAHPIFTNKKRQEAAATSPLAMVGGWTQIALHAAAMQLHKTIQALVKEDILRTTPYRIQQMLAADLDNSEFASIRKRVYDTVILGKGLHANDADETVDIATGASGPSHDVEKYKKCPSCGNNDQSSFVLDRKNGDVICSNCGTVVSESIMHEGSQYRKFEGEADRNHHGDAANPLYSNAHNMGTTLSGVTMATGAGIGGWGSGGSGGKRNLETILRNAHAYTELNVSQFGKTDRRTRVGYKDRQKKDAFLQMAHTGDALNLHEAVVQRAKELFAGFRDDRELVQQFKGVLAACLCEAFEQLSAEGKLLLRQQQLDAVQQQMIQQQQQQEKDAAKNRTQRVSRRNELHHASMAGKGGLLLDYSHTSAVGTEPASATTGAGTPAPVKTEPETANLKSIATWDLEDCRSWLLEASRTIAQQWAEDRKKNPAAAKKLPSSPLEELEGQLVEHSITLCEQLESELRSLEKRPEKSKRVITPRAGDMSKLGIRWQHSYERGSGGKGGVGGSGHGKKDIGGSGKTAGQILILKTAAKLGAILKDALAGEAFHRELAAVKGQQEARKFKDRQEEASRRRLIQMQRKPWLKARAQIGT